MKILKYALTTVLALVALLGLVGLLLPDRVHVERSIEVDANPSTVFTVLNSYKLFNQWSPWHERDPSTEYEYSGPRSGVEAGMTWKSEQRDVGAGRQKIVESEAYDHITVQLNFEGQGDATASYEIEAVNGGAEITWTLDTEFGYNLVGRYFGLMFDKWVGADYEKGLGNLKRLVEDLPDQDFSDTDPQILDVEAVDVAYVSGSTSDNPTAIAAALAIAYLEVGAFMELNDLRRSGPPRAVSRAREDGSYDFDAAIPISASIGGSADSKVSLSTTYAGTAARGTHVGPYQMLSSTHEKVAAFVAASGLEQNGDPWQEYITDPGTTTPDKLITHVYIPVR